MTTATLTRTFDLVGPAHTCTVLPDDNGTFDVTLRPHAAGPTVTRGRGLDFDTARRLAESLQGRLVTPTRSIA